MTAATSSLSFRSWLNIVVTPSPRLDAMTVSVLEPAVPPFLNAQGAPHVGMRRGVELPGEPHLEVGGRALRIEALGGDGADRKRGVRHRPHAEGRGRPCCSRGVRLPTCPCRSRSCPAGREAQGARAGHPRRRIPGPGVSRRRAAAITPSALNTPALPLMLCARLRRVVKSLARCACSSALRGLRSRSARKGRSAAAGRPRRRRAARGSHRDALLRLHRPRNRYCRPPACPCPSATPPTSPTTRSITARNSAGLIGLAM